MAKLNEVFTVKEAVDPKAEQYVRALERHLQGLQMDIADLKNGTANLQDIGTGLVNRSIEIKALGDWMYKGK